ncbi:hypothetical protein [Alicyclobacillus suci]|uniref:hypothetical protein n=1 Tax=Alicyclobacillus suci TaxID=2816080 RepID=UPI001A8EC585|nr:hypothetical protein [Alicyclobacillus suci]
MKLFFVALFWRLAIGLCISIIGIIISLITSKWYITDNWLGLFGLIIMASAALPFIGGGNAAVQTAWERPKSFMQQFKESRGFSNSWTFTAFLIGLPNLIVAMIATHITH